MVDFAAAALLLVVATPGSFAFAPTPFGTRPSTFVQAEIRGPTDKSDVLRYGWDGTTPLGGAVEVAKPSRFLEDIRAAGEAVPSECEVRAVPYPTK